MNQHRFSLQLYKGPASRYPCPQCETPKKFARYIDREGEIELPDFVGRCERQGNCTYHYTPRQLFAEYPDYKPSQNKSIQRSMLSRGPIPGLAKPAPPTSQVDPDIVSRTLNQYGRNNLMLYLFRLLGEPIARELAALYQIGSSDHWHKQGATVFWQRDEKDKVRAGKVMLYNQATGKRRKEDAYQPTWVHSLLKLPEFTLSQCLFGLHQLPARPDADVAIVESEKTALIATAFDPCSIWLATGGKDGLTVERCRALSGRKVVLYPDLSADNSVYTKWVSRAKELAMIPGIQIKVSRFLEDKATDEDRANGLDIADYLTRHQCLSSGRVLNKSGAYPALWDAPSYHSAPLLKVQTFAEWHRQHFDFALSSF